MPFVNLHLHTEYSLLDGLTKIKKLVTLLKEQGATACAITDHGNMYGAIEFYKACKKAEIKPIIGAEMYMSSGSRFEKNSQNRRNFHLILLAKNTQGYKNLMKLVSIGQREGFYYKPRIDWESLKKYHQGLVCLSACTQGQVASEILSGDYDKAKNTASRFQKLFDDDYYLEIQRHQGINEQDIANKGIIKISRELGIPLVATNDCHYLIPTDAFAQDVLMMINTQSTVNTPNRLSMVNTPDFYVKSPKEMEEQFKDYPEAIENTQKIADKCDLTIELGKWYFPKFKLPNDLSAEEVLRQKVYQGANEIYGSNLSTEIKQRLEYELEIICTKGYAAYFLIMNDFILWCKANDTPTNTRGSAGGSLVSYCLDIVSVDPLVYGLPFERFLNMDRPSPPDIDLDIADDQRQDMLFHIIKQYGEDTFAQICTFGRMLARGAVRDTARVLGYEYAIGDKISKLIPLGSQGFPMSIDKALNITPELQQLYDTDSDSRKILDTARQIEGNARHISVHACAIVISPTSIQDFCPIQTETGGEKPITQYEMHACEDVGLIKFDILGIRNLSFLRQAVINVRKTRNLEIDLRKLPLDDKKTFEMLSRGDTMGVFQLGGDGMTKWLKELKPNRVEDLMAMVALYRPGPMAIIPEYIARKRDPSKIEYFDEKMKKYLQASYGLLIYQDDCLYTAIELANYNWVEVDKFRKAIGKKIPEEMAAQKEKFISGCVANGYTQKKAEEIFKLIEPFTSYGFNKAHAASYGMLAYRTGYMKANFPVEYMCALLTAEANDIDKIAAGIEECRKMGIIVSPPDINLSQKAFEFEKNDQSLEKMAIRVGLSAIKNVGDIAIDLIIKERNENGPFKNFNDFCLRTNAQKVNKKVLESLIRVGAFDNFGERNAILAGMDEIRNKCTRINNKKDSGQFGLFDNSDTDTTIPPDIFPQVEFMSEKEKLIEEKKLLGIFVTENPISKILSPFKNAQLSKISEIINKGQNEIVKFAAIIQKFKIIRTKKDNKSMAFINFDDGTATMEGVIFPKIYEIYKDIIEENKGLYVEGKISLRDDKKSIIVDSVSEKLPQNVNTYDFIINIPNGTSSSTLMKLDRLLKKNPNGHRGLLVLPNNKEIKLNYGVNYTPNLEAEVKELLSHS